MLAEGSSDMVTRIGLDERISYVSPSCASVVGWRADQLTGTAALVGVNALDLPRVEETVAALRRGDAEEARISYRTRHREKAEIWIESNLRVTRKVDGEIDGVVAISRDITEQKGLEERLETLAVEDGLTGLANRRRFDERLQEEWTRAFRDNKPLALLDDRRRRFQDIQRPVWTSGGRCVSAFSRQGFGRGGEAHHGSRSEIWRRGICFAVAQHRCSGLRANWQKNLPRTAEGRHISQVKPSVREGYRKRWRSGMLAGQRSIRASRFIG